MSALEVFVKSVTAYLVGAFLMGNALSEMWRIYQLSLV